MPDAKGVTPRLLSAACAEVLANLVASGAYADAASVNAGYCGDFADDVYELLRARGFNPHDDLDQLGIEGFLVPDEDMSGPPRFDRDLVTRHWPAMAPPDGLDWDAMDAVASDADFNAGTHTWILLDGLHYDAEAPEGVGNPLALPFFVRLVARRMEDAPPCPTCP